VRDNLAQAHWEKLTWNIPFNGLGVASAAGKESFIEGKETALRSSCLTTDKLIGDPDWARLVSALIREVIAAARSLGFNLDDNLEEVQLARTRTMGAYKPSTLIDFERGQPLELNSLFLEPLYQARRSGVKAPTLTKLCEVLQKLDKESHPRKA
jgi:2-dehydropantoate 2-reductase